MRNALFIEISDKIRKRISAESEQHQSDWSLPTLNELAKEYRTSIVTAKKAIDVLSHEGITYARPGVGIKVNNEMMKGRRRILESFSIGVVFTDIFEVSEGVIGDIVKGIAESQNALGFNLKLISIPSTESIEQQIAVVQDAIDRGVDGLIIASRMPLRLIAALQERKTAIVWLNNNVQHERIPAVVFDKTQLFLEVINRLKELKAKDVALIAPCISIEDGKLFDGLCQGAGLPKRRIYTHYELKKEAEIQALAKADTLAALSTQAKPDVIVCGGETATFGALQALATTNLKISKDIHVVSIVEREGLQSKLTAPVDMIVQSFSTLAKDGAAMLHEILNGRFPDPHIKYIRCNLLKGAADEC